jgi:hypothetical protein
MEISLPYELIDLEEIQSLDLKEVVKYKAHQAYLKL